MTTAAQLARRIEAEYLTPASDAPPRSTLTAAITTTTSTSVAFSTSPFGVDEISAWAPGRMVQVDYELMLIKSHNGSGALTVVRGMDNTDAATHPVDTIITLSPLFPTSATLSAIYDAVAALFPHLKRRITTPVSIALDFTEIPAEATEAFTTATILRNGKHYEIPCRIVENFPPSSTGKAVIFPDASRFLGYQAYVTYTARFGRPDIPSADLTNDYGILPEWERLVALDAVATVLLGGPEVAMMTPNAITEELSTQSFEPTTSHRLATNLLAIRERRLQEAADDQQHTGRIVYNHPNLARLGR